MKKRIILSSIITMLLCLCMIAGATYALFTSESKVNIAVTSGKVEVEAGITDLKLYSFNVEQNGFFENGGTAVYENGVLTLENLTPGDKVEFNIYVKNNSNIDVKYRTKWAVEGELGEALEAYIVTDAGDEALANVGWKVWKASALEKQQVIKVKVELPVQVGNEYQEKAANISFVVEAIQANGVVSNYATPYTIDDVLAMAEEGAEIELASGYYESIVVPYNGMTIFSEQGAEVGFLNVNGKDNVTIKGLTFNAAGAQVARDGKGTGKQWACLTGASDTVNKKGTRNLVIDGCTFEGTFANGGVAIAFVDQNRGTGASGNITIKNCEFNTVNSYYDIYCHYSGLNGFDFIIENNTFASERSVGITVYLGRYASSNPVVVKNNTFKTVTVLEDAVYVQDHSSYGVSVDAQNNKFKK